MAMNGRKGRAKELARIRRKIEREAAQAGVDVTDRAAVNRWHDEQMQALYARIQRNAGRTVDKWD
jgi:hypothetical protein